MIIYTIGFTRKSAQKFFELIKANNVEIVVDIRLNNKSQLAGFTKGDDLWYFLDEICNCKYKHCVEYAPTKDILNNYKKKIISWDEYVAQYIPLMQKRNAVQTFAEKFGMYKSVCLLCSEPTPEYCHRRLLSEMIASEYPETIVMHI